MKTTCWQTVWVVSISVWSHIWISMTTTLNMPPKFLNCLQKIYKKYKEEIRMKLQRPLAVVWMCCLMLLSGCAMAQRDPLENESLVSDPRVQHRSYVFAPTGETLPYALFVPPSYRPGQPTPLLVSLHGLGRTYDWLMGYEGFLDYAEEYGFIVVTPLGYSRRGWYGSRPTETAVIADY